MRYGRSTGLVLGTLAAAMLLGSSPARAVDNLIPGKIALIKTGNLAKGVFKGTFAIPASIAGSSLNLFDTLSTGGSNTYALAEGQFKGLGNPAGSKGWKYKGTGSPTDPCKVVLFKSSVIKYVCKGSGVTLAPGFGGDLGVIMTTGGDRYCASFGGTTIKNEPNFLKRKDAPAPGACPTASSTTSTSSTSSTTTTTAGGACCNDATRLSFTTGVGSGNCGSVFRSDGTTFINLSCGGLYFGGGSNSVPLPATVPDMGQSLTKITACTGQAATLANTTAGETGSNLNCTSVGCLFGAPLPIPNANSIPTSTCVVNSVSANATGTANCSTGASQIALPLNSQIFLTGDLLPAVTGIQPCPLCTGGVCDGGDNDGMPCDPETGALNDAFPTSHDCPPPAAADIGGLPIGFNLTTGTQTRTAAPISGQLRVFCGFCRDVDDTGDFQQPAVSCDSPSDCTNPTFEACQQRNNGAFGPSGGGGNTISATGQAAGDLNDGAAHASKLVSIFCIPPTFNATVDAAADLPGPGASALQGQTQLLP